MNILDFIITCLPAAVSLIKVDQEYDRVAQLENLLRDKSNTGMNFNFNHSCFISHVSFETKTNTSAKQNPF